MGSLVTRLRRETDTGVEASHSHNVPGMRSDHHQPEPLLMPELQPQVSVSTATSEKDNEDVKEVCLGPRQLFVKDLHGNTRCVDVQEETTIAELTLQLETEKILPPGGSLMAGSKKLKKTQLMSEVPSNIEVVLALCGGAPTSSK
ncbi:Hypp636 [Branchiostoma lanceolatum]|uniref:Hypp636 protein n=1 Tax=Branchiostoma lanceolatum TaxID=7740 RepID=A0A8J9VVU5_BRALA|nr:Hypp636 [Branchiostoma lanceolatum]